MLDMGEEMSMSDTGTGTEGRWKSGSWETCLCGVSLPAGGSGRSILLTALQSFFTENCYANCLDFQA